MFAHIFTVKTLIRVALTALSIANIGVARAEISHAASHPVVMSDTTGARVAGALN